MRTVLTACLSPTILLLCAFLTGSSPDEPVTIRVRLVDASTNNPIGGMLRIKQDGARQYLKLPGLLDRLIGCKLPEANQGWHVVPVEGGDIALPRQLFHVEALHGLETAQVEQLLDLRHTRPAELLVKLPFLFRPETHRLVAGNTHLHLRGLTRAAADDYLRTIPAADGLKVLFISYLERHLDDLGYITNRYPIGDLKDLGGAGLAVANGEEHRHNFEGYGQGYGHVMLLGIKQLVKPVSLGPGITKAGNDDRPLRPGIDDARGQGGTIVWCHNTYGHEGVPNMLSGRLDALNVFDGTRRDSYEHLYYRFLNIGLRVPLSTGTDWFLYDFSRVYVGLRGDVTTGAWLKALKAGNTLATNGPLLTLKVDGKAPGTVLELTAPRKVHVEATGKGRLNFDRFQLVWNGKVVHTESAAAIPGGFAATLSREIKVEGPGWFAVRIDSVRRNEFDQQLFAHTSPVFVDISGRRVFDVDAAAVLLRLLEGAVAAIGPRGQFSRPAARDRLLAVYEQAAGELRNRMNQRGR